MPVDVPAFMIIQVAPTGLKNQCVERQGSSGRSWRREKNTIKYCMKKLNKNKNKKPTNKAHEVGRWGKRRED